MDESTAEILAALDLTLDGFRRGERWPFALGRRALRLWLEHPAERRAKDIGEVSQYVRDETLQLARWVSLRASIDGDSVILDRVGPDDPVVRRLLSLGSAIGVFLCCVVGSGTLVEIDSPGDSKLLQLPDSDSTELYLVVGHLEQVLGEIYELNESVEEGGEIRLHRRHYHRLHILPKLIDLPSEDALIAAIPVFDADSVMWTGQEIVELGEGKFSTDTFARSVKAAGLKLGKVGAPPRRFTEAELEVIASAAEQKRGGSSKALAELLFSLLDGAEDEEER